MSIVLSDYTITTAGPLPVVDEHPHMDAALDVRTIGDLVRTALRDIHAGVAYGTKAVLQPDERELLPLLDADELDPRFGDERLNWKLNTLVSANARYCAVKLVGSNAYNRILDQPRSRSLLVLYDKLSMHPLTIYDGTELSARRTGAYASVVVDLMLQQPRFSVCLYGCGPIADCVLDDLQAHHAQRISHVLVYSRTGESAIRFALAASLRTGMDIRAVREKPPAGDADLIITATNARRPVLDCEQIGSSSVVLHLGGDELSPVLIERMLRHGDVACDDPHTVCHRNSQSLPLFFSRQGLRLRDLARLYHVQSLPALLARPLKRSDGPGLVTCVGLPALDLCLAQWLYEHAGRQYTGTVRSPLPDSGLNTDPAMAGLPSDPPSP